MAFYKQIGEDWFEANIVSNANYTLDENNRENDQGWEWHDTPPQDYLVWLEELDDGLLNDL